MTPCHTTLHEVLRGSHPGYNPPWRTDSTRSPILPKTHQIPCHPQISVHLSRRIKINSAGGADDLDYATTNKGLDTVESRFPYPFQTPTEDILKDIKANSDHAKGVATKTIDERVRAPAYNIAQGIDQVSTHLL